MAENSPRSLADLKKNRDAVKLLETVGTASGGANEAGIKAGAEAASASAVTPSGVSDPPVLLNSTEDNSSWLKVWMPGRTMPVGPLCITGDSDHVWTKNSGTHDRLPEGSIARWKQVQGASSGRGCVLELADESGVVEQSSVWFGVR